MKTKTKLIIACIYLMFVITLMIKLFITFKGKVVNIQEFTDYYEKGESQNGGLELLSENFTTFSREYIIHIKNKDVKKNKEIKKIDMLSYKVILGDNFTKISNKLGISVDTLKIHNPSIRNGRLIANKELVYPSRDGLFYKIKKRDSLIKISKKYSINVADILENNNINPRKLKINDKIFLPNVSYKNFLKVENYFKNNAKVTNEKNNNETKNNKNLRRRSSLGFSFPVRYKGVASPFGNRFHPVLRRYILHTGVDLKAKFVPLRASKDGVVSFAGYMNGYGKIIIIKHENNYETRYAHLSVISTRVGEKVKKGELIGKTGNTGRVTGPHLHFEIRYKGIPKNPMRYL